VLGALRLGRGRDDDLLDARFPRRGHARDDVGTVLRRRRLEERTVPTPSCRTSKSTTWWLWRCGKRGQVAVNRLAQLNWLQLIDCDNKASSIATCARLIVCVICKLVCGRPVGKRTLVLTWKRQDSPLTTESFHCGYMVRWLRPNARTLLSRIQSSKELPSNGGSCTRSAGLVAALSAHFQEYASDLRQQFDSADLVVGHNVDFDLRMVITSLKKRTKHQ